MICLCIGYFNKNFPYRAYTYCGVGKNEEKTEYFDVEELKNLRKFMKWNMHQVQHIYSEASITSKVMCSLKWIEDSDHKKIEAANNHHHEMLKL